MKTFAIGTKVQKKGSQQVMEVIGEVDGGPEEGSRIPSVKTSMIACRWANQKGKSITREFAAADLVAVT